MILYKTTAKFSEICNKIRENYLMEVIGDLSIGRAIKKAVCAIGQTYIQRKYSPIIQSLSHLEKLYASINYTSVDRRRVVVRTNMGLLFREASDNGEIL